MKFAKHKKVFAFLLVFTMLFSGMSTYASGIEEKEEASTQGSVGQETESKEAESKEAEGKEAVVDETGKEETGLENPENNVEDSTTQEVQQPEKKDSEESKDAQSKAADVNAPVIEKVSLDKQGETVEVGDTVTVTVEAYDADSSIASVTVGIRWRNRYDSVYLAPKEGKVYEGVYTVPKEAQGRTLEISDVSVSDVNGNNAVGTVKDDQGKAKYYFQVAGEPDDEKPIVNKVEIEQQGKEVKPDEMVKISVEATDNNELSSYGNASFRTSGTNYKTLDLHLTYNTESGRFEGEAKVEKMISGKWALSSLYIRDIYDNECELPSNAADIWFTVADPDDDSEKPVIKSVKFDQQGKVVEPGETVTLQIEATDNKKISQVNAGVNPSGINNAGKYLTLTHKEGDIYEAVIMIEDSMPTTEWYLYYFNVTDEYGNQCSMQDFNPQAYNSYPWYFYVGKDGSTTIPTFDLTVNFRGLDSKGNSVNLETQTFSRVESRTKLSDLLKGKYPDASTSYEGFKFQHWADSQGRKIEDIEVVRSSAPSNGLYLTAVYDKSIFSTTYTYIDKNGDTKYLENVRKVYPAGTTYGTAIKDSKKRELPKDNYANLPCSEWTTMYQVDETQVIGTNSNVNLIPDYEKSIVKYSYQLLDEKGNWITDTEVKLFPKGTAGNEALNEGQKKEPIQFKDLIFGGWSSGGTSLTELPPYSTIYMQAKYKDHTVAELRYSYYDEKGEYQYTNDTKVLEKGSYNYDEVIAEAAKKTIDAHHPQLGFKQWRCTMPPGESNTVDYFNIYFNAEYEKCLVRLYVGDEIIDGHTGDLSGYPYKDIRVVEKGSKITLPKTVTGFKDIVWEMIEDQDKPVTVDYHTTIVGIGVKDENAKPDPTPDPDPKPDPKPDPTPTPDPTPNPAPDPGTPLPPQIIENKKSEIAQSAGNGEKIEIKMAESGATQIPKDILEAAKGKNTNLVLDMGGYTWTINGMDILASDLKDINLEVKTDTNAIPNSLISSIAGNNPVKQLSLTHNGDFGFRATLTVNVGKEYYGKYGNLFYHDSSGKMVYMNAGSIDADGNVSLGFSHASDYAVVIADQIMGGGTQGTPENKSPRTGDVNSIALYLGIMGIAALAFGTVTYSRKKKAK